MLNRNEAQKRPGIKLSAPMSLQTLPRAQTHPKGCLTLQLKKSQPGATTAAEGSAGTKSTPYTRRIPGGPASPSPLSPTTHDARPTPQQAAPTTLGEAQHARMAQQAQHYSIEKGSEQPGSNGLQLGDRSTPAAASARCTLQLESTTTRAKLRTSHTHWPARDPPFGAGHEQAKLSMNPLPASNKKINSDNRKKLQTSTQAPEARQLLKDHGKNALIQLKRLVRNAPHLPEKDSEQASSNSLQLGDSPTPAAASARCTSQLESTTTWAKLSTPHMHWHARDLPLGAGHEQAKLAMDPLPASTKKINSEDRKKL